jgi:signal transduction histidine kinase
MRPPALRIRDKITIPFILLAFAGITVTALLSVNLISGVLEQRFEKQLIVTSELLSQANYVRNPAILERVKTIIGADILTFEGGEAVASTLSAIAERKWVMILKKPGSPGPDAASAGPTIRYIELSDRPYTFVHRPLLDGSGAVVVIMKETSDAAQARRSVAKPIIMIGVVMAVLMSLISHLVTRSITSPLQKLSRASKKLAAGDWNAMMDTGTSDEVGELAKTLNEMARELRRGEEKLLRSEKLSMTGYLAARVAHDIRNPLFSIKMRAQMICERMPLGGSDRASLEPILKDIEQVEWVVQGLLDLASPVKLNLEEASINEILEDVLASIGDHLEHARIKVERELSANLPLIQVDPGRLKQVLLNLVLNAAEAMPEGGILGARTDLEDDPGSVLIEIWDIGEGIDEIDRERLFDPFFTTKRDGVGLGLVNAKSLVESHGGSLELLPRDGRGTRAVVRLPIQPDVEAPQGDID